MTANDLRRSFLDYFKGHGHRIVASSSLVPHEDPTLLFTNAGMNQFKDVFLGRETRDYTRATTSQKCMRVSGKHNDLDNVGPSLRHHTFFEMLGNFSFGDYFKQDAIPLAWNLLTRDWGLPPDRLFATVFRGDASVPRDDEAYAIWRGFLPESHVSELGAADNFWQMGETGPCGRCSEIYVYRGDGLPCAEERAGGACRGLECSCDRYTEIWNNVFMEFDRQPGGTLAPLPAPSIDTGMGLDRLATAMGGLQSNYENDLFSPLLLAIAEAAGLTDLPTSPTERVRVLATQMSPTAVSSRVVADHLRAMTFLIGDGVVPSNEWRGYVLRKIMRRAMRHGKRLGMTEPFLHDLVGTVVSTFGGAYPELATSREAVTQVVRSEEERFDAVLTGGLPRLEEALDRAATGGVLDGDTAFRLYDTYGLPRDFIEDMVEDRRLALDREGFDRAMEVQREKARARSSFKGGAEGRSWTMPEEAVESLRRLEDAFTGYDGTSTPATIVALFRTSAATHELTERLTAGEAGLAVLDRTPFYLEAGGQVSDTGHLSSPQGTARVEGVVRPPQFSARAHVVFVETGALQRGDQVTAGVDQSLRDATRRNHTATHLLHAALRQVLGGHVKQAGSLVAPDRLRFDFVHFTPIRGDQLRDIETIVNAQVLANAPVQTSVMATTEAIAAGAMALFGEKYGERVRVVSVPGFSTELCGGTHVRATGDIGLFAITSEAGVAAGVRRIEAVTGLGSLSAFQRDRDELGAIASALNARPGELPARVAALNEENRRLARELQQSRMKAALAGGSTGAGADADVSIGTITLVARQVADLDKDGLRALVDQHRSRIGSGVVVLASPGDGKVAVVVGVTPDLTRQVPAGQVVKKLAPIVGGGGGGRPDFAEAGGKDASKVAEMLAQSRQVVEQMLTQSS